jgi:sulfur carrier protein ThiS
MTVTIKYSVRDLVGDMRDGAYELPEDTTIEGLILASEMEVGKILSEDVRKSFIFLVNSKPAVWETVLHDGDKVRVLYKILGG